MNKPTTRRANFQAIGNQLASLEENESTPWLVRDGIHEHLSQLISVVPLWNPRVLKAVYWVLCEEAEAQGIDLAQIDYVGQSAEHERTSAAVN